MRPVSLRRLLDGPAPALPGWIDGLAERWWGLPPRTRFALAALGVVLVGLVGVGHLASSPFGPPRTVLVANDDLPVGHRLAAGDLRATGWPRDLVPSGAFTSRPAELHGLTVTAPLPTDAVVTDRHVGDMGIVGLVPPGRVAVAVDAALFVDLPAGATVDLVSADLHGVPTHVAHRARVIAEDGHSVWLAVAPSEGAGVAGAAASGALSGVVHPPEASS